MDKLTRLYDRLTAEERLRAFYEAAANKDPAEMDKLNATCPRRTYTMDDWAYTRTKYNMLVITLALHGDAAFYAQSALFALACNVLFEAREEDDMAKPGQTEELFEFAIRHYKKCIRAYDRFCEEVGLDPATMRQACGVQENVPMQIAMNVADELVSAEPEPGEVEALTNSLLKLWRGQA
jgi:hypothetical protein